MDPERSEGGDVAPEDGSRAPQAHDQGARDTERLTIWSVIGSTVAAAFGVQSRRNRERDFSRGNVMTFIVAGAVFTIVFVVSIVIVVNMVLSGLG